MLVLLGIGGVGMVLLGLVDMVDVLCWLLDCVGFRVDGLLMGIWFELICLEGWFVGLFFIYELVLFVCWDLLEVGFFIEEGGCWWRMIWSIEVFFKFDGLIRKMEVVGKWLWVLMGKCVEVCK